MNSSANENSESESYAGQSSSCADSGVDEEDEEEKDDIFASRATN